MKSRILYISTLVLLVCGMAVIVAPVSAGPAIKIVESEFDFGKTMQHVKVTHDFWIKSIGDAPLVITKIVPGCGCTEVPLKDSVIAPGDSTVLSITFSTKSFAGNITKKPYFLTNISEAPVRLTIKANVVVEPEKMAPLKMTPFELDVSQPGDREQRHAIFLIQNQGDRDLKLNLIDQPVSLFEASLPAEIKAGETAEAMIVVRKEAATVEFEKSVTFEVNDADKTRYSLPVTRLSRSSAAATQ